MSANNQPPAQAIADLPVAMTVLAAFASVAGQLGLVARAAKGAAVLMVGAWVLSLVLPPGGVFTLFLILVSFAATSHFGFNWCRVMLLGPQGLPARSLAWREPHWRFFGYALLLFLVMLLSTLPMSAIGSIIAGILGLAAAPGAAGPRMFLAMLLVFLGIVYVLARLGFVFPAAAVEENYSLRLAWQHTAGQGLRMTAALFAAALPIVLVQLLLTVLLLEGLLGISLAQMLETASEPAGTSALAEGAGGEGPSLAAALLFNLVAIVLNFLSFAVMFSLLSLAFRTCTGWVPAGGGKLPAERRDEGDGGDAGF